MELIHLQAIVVSTMVLGSLYALMGTGLSLVWGTLRMFNFTHGALMMLGAYVAWSVTNALGPEAGLTIAVIVSIISVAGVGVVIERILVRPFVSRPNAAVIAIITTISGSVFLENGALILWGPRMKQLARLIPGEIRVLGVAVSSQEAFIMVVAPVLLLLIGFFLKHCFLGLAIRAVEQNQDAALLLGVNVPAIYRTTFALSAGLAACAGVMLGAMRFITPAMGGAPLLKAFIVVILGGLGSMGGTIAGAYVVGFLEALSSFFLGLYWTPAVLFTVMILVMVFKPTGLFGGE